MEPIISYALNGDVAIAYEVIGEGPVDLLYLAPINNLEIVWENPHYARFLRRLSDFSRVILMDRRGTGLSDRFSSPTVFGALFHPLGGMSAALACPVMKGMKAVERALCITRPPRGGDLFGASRPLVDRRTTSDDMGGNSE